MACGPSGLISDLISRITTVRADTTRTTWKKSTFVCSYPQQA